MGIKEFAEKLSADSAFAENQNGLKDAAAFIEQAIKDGYTITAEEVAELANGKISDEELNGVTGGGRFMFNNNLGLDIQNDDKKVRNNLI